MLTMDSITLNGEPRPLDAPNVAALLDRLGLDRRKVAVERNTEIVPDEPATMDDAISAGEAAVKSGKVESALNLPVGELGDAYHMDPILTSFGGYIFSYDEATGYDAQDVGIGKDGSVKAAEEISRLAKAKVLRTSISGDNSIALFTSKKAAFLISGP